MNEEPKKNYYAIIPANVRYDDNLTANAKLLYGEITALCNEKGYCWAKNDYFSKLYKVSKTSISKWISQLVNGGYISNELIYKEGTKEIDKRYLRLVTGGVQQKLNTPIEEKLIDNNTVINNTINNTNIKPLSGKPDPIDYQGLINYFNLKAGRNFKATDAFKRMINGRLKEGHEKMDFKIVIDKKCDEWLGTEMESYLRPNTLFCPKHFDNYLNQPVVQRKNNKSAQLNAFEALERKYSDESESSVSTVKENQFLLSE